MMFEGAREIRPREENILLEGSRNELSIVYSAIFILICSPKHLIDFWGVQIKNLADIIHARFQLLYLEQAIVVRVQLFEHFTHFD